MSELSKQNQTTQEKNENNFLYNELYPAYLNIIGVFISELIEKYLLTSFQSFLPIPIAKNLCEATVSTPERKVNIETKPATTLYSP